MEKFCAGTRDLDDIDFTCCGAFKQSLTSIFLIEFLLSEFM